MLRARRTASGSDARPLDGTSTWVRPFDTAPSRGGGDSSRRRRRDVPRLPDGNGVLSLLAAGCGETLATTSGRVLLRSQCLGVSVLLRRCSLKEIRKLNELSNERPAGDAAYVPKRRSQSMTSSASRMRHCLAQFVHTIRRLCTESQKDYVWRANKE